jgi:type I restriction enzyme M protein
LEKGELIMAKRICFISTPYEYQIYKEIEVEFEYFNGFAVSQKQKSIRSLHENVNKMDKSLEILEVSTKSTNPIGVALSAFNLKFYEINTDKEYPLENIFQSSKVFERGGPYRDLLNVHPKDAKRDERLKSSGNLIHFNYNGTIWEKEPKTMFYDWIYMSSLYRNESLSKKILEYNAFTDIEFNQEKSINCQARSAAIFVSLCKLGKLEKVLNNKEELKRIYSKGGNDNTQMSLFDL